MCYLKKISNTGLKSGDFCHELDRLNLIVGRSARNKTAVLDAIRLVLTRATILGRSAELNGTTVKIMDLARNGHIEVSAEDQAGRRRTLRWNRGKKDPVEVAVEFPGAPNLLADPSEYIGLSDAKKVEYAFKCYRMDESPEFNPVAITQKIRNLPAPQDEHHTAAHDSILEMLRAETTVQAQSGGTIQRWIETVVGLLRKRLSNAIAAAERMTKTVQGITALQTNVSLRNPEPDLVAKRSHWNEICIRQNSHELSLRELDDLEQRAKEIAGQIAEFPLVDNATLATEIAETTKEIQRIEASSLVVSSELAALDEQKLRAELDSLNIEISARVSGLPDAMKTLAELEFRKFQATTFIANQRAIIKTRTEQFEIATRRKCCAACGAAPEHWAGEYSREAQKQAFNKWLSEAEAKIRQQEEVESSSEKLLNAARAVVQAEETRDKDIAEKRQRAAAIQLSLNRLAKAQNDARAEKERILTAKRRELTALEAKRQSIAISESRRAELTAKLDEVKARAAKVDRAEIQKAVERCNIAVRDLNVEIGQLETQKAIFLKAQADEQRNAQALLEHAKACADVAVTKMVIAELERIQSEMVELAFEAILKTVNSVTSPLIPEPIQYRDGEIGRWVNGTWVKHESFSAAEKSLTYAGVSLALSKDSPIKIILLDTFESVNPPGPVVDRMRQLVECGVIDQFVAVVSTEHPEHYNFEGVKVVLV